MAQTIRAFIAVEIPGGVKTALAELQQAVGRAGFRMRWVRSGNIHLTLRFLGDIQLTEKDRVAGKLEEIAGETEPFFLSVAGTGVFPGIRKPRVFWAGLGGDLPPLHALAANLETGLETLGFQREKRPFRGHLTLGRFKGTADIHQLKTTLRDTASFVSEQFRVDRVSLVQSRLTPDGAVYRRLTAADLGRR